MVLTAESQDMQSNGVAAGKKMLSALRVPPFVSELDCFDMEESEQYKPC